MSLNISSNNYIKETIKTSDELNIVQNVITTNNKTSLAVNLEPKQNILNKETIVQLQEVQNYSIFQISCKKEEIDFNGTPSLEWLKGYCGDDRLYDENVQSLYRGCESMKKFSEIVDRNKNNNSISYEDWNFITSRIERFQNGYTNNREQRNNSPDLIIHKVLDFIAPKTLQRIEVLKQYLSTKTKEPEILFELKDVDIKETTDIATINNSTCEKTDNLLDFLTKDLKWYKWYLEDQVDRATSYSLKLFHLSYSRQLEIRQVS